MIHDEQETAPLDTPSTLTEFSVPAVGKFAAAMNHEIYANEPEKGMTWKTDNPLDLLNHLQEEVHELASVASALHIALEDEAHRQNFVITPEYLVTLRARVLEEAADVGNMAMMVADRLGALE